jgi:hypothetical protein
MTIFSWSRFFLCGLIVANCVQVQAQQSTVAADKSAKATDLDGRTVDPFADRHSKAIVLLFVCTDCPIANRYAPTIQKIYETYHQKQVAFWLVYADPSESPEKIREHLKAYKHQAPALRDPEHRLVALSRAKKTPEVAVFQPGQKLAYRGRIDDLFTDYGKSRNEATQHDLRDALDAILNGRPVKHPTTEAIGCHIPDIDR